MSSDSTNYINSTSHPNSYNQLNNLKFLLSNLRIYAIAFFAVLGLFLNSFCILINMKINFTFKSINVNKTFIIGLAIFDLIKLLVDSIFPLAELNYNNLVTDEWCQIRYWLKYTSGEVCSWILVVMSIDRIMAFLGQKYSKFTVKSQSKVEKAMRRNSRIILIIIIFIFSLINSIFFLPNTIYSVSTGKNLLKCQNNNRGFGLDVFEHTWFNLTWFQTFYSFAYSFCPSAILIITSAIIINIISKYAALSQKFNRSNTKKLRKLKESGLVMVFLSAFFLVSTLPVQISILFIDIYYKNAHISDIANCFYYVFSIIEASNHSCNFLIYILIDKTVRHQFLSFIKK